MANTFSQMYIHIVFAVKARQCQIHPSWEAELYKFITGVVQRNGQKMLAINGMPDHIHIFIGMKPTCCLSDLVREIKKASNSFINENRLSSASFQWQEGFGAFSYGHSALKNVIHYILNQKTHHQTKTFKQEYVDMLVKFNVDYKPDYLFEWTE